MAVRVYIPTPYRSFTGEETHVTAEAGTVADLLRVLADRYPGLGTHIFSADGHIPGHLNVYVNQVEMRTLDGEATALHDGDEIALIPAMAGGAPLLTAEQMNRYSRHTRLDEVGVEGQRRLLDSKVLLIGAGALASPAAIYLAAAGVGTIGIVDGDRVDASNLQRQILHFAHDVGRPKVQSARRHIEDLNPDVKVVTHPVFLNADNALEILKDYDMIVNGSDNFPTRYLVNDACVLLGKPLADASILKWEGQATVFLPGKGCYRCLFPSPPPPGSVPSCAEAGVVGALAGHLGTLQAVETIKVLLGVGKPLSNRLILYDAMAGDYQSLRWARNPNCPICGDHPTINALVDYEGFCGIPLPGHDAASGAPALDIGVPNGWDLAPQVALAELQAGAHVIDVREASDFERQHIPGSEHMGLGDLVRPGNGMDRSATTIVVCTVGARSAIAVELLRRAGFERAFNLQGGFVAWENEQLPLEGTGKAAAGEHR